jgi:ribosomal protein L11 methyltransferase
VARETFAANGMPDIELNDQQVEDITEKYDIVLANIIDGVLVRIQEALKARTGKWLILSGIILEREKDFLAGFKLPEGKHWNLRRQKGDWLVYAARL